jgi:D-alanyl-D-alanine carboxypeptidase/D-alanyl-D-alanine-endopeptidase (penicillin-binding protein 4)
VRTSNAATLTVAILVTVGVTVGYAVDHHHSSPKPAAAPVTTTSGTPVPLPSSAPPRAPVLGQLDPTASRPTAQGVSAKLAAATGPVTSGAHLVGEVADADTGAVLWARGTAVPEPPASTTKLLTATAALAALGPNFRLQTTTRLVGHTVYLVGGGDPTVVRSDNSADGQGYPPPASLATLARRTAKALGTVHNVRLRLDTSAWSGPSMARGWKPSYVTEGDITPPSALELDEGKIDPSDEFASRSPTPAAQAGDAFVELLRADGVHVVGKVALGAAGSGSKALASIDSPPLSDLVENMLTVSDDDVAEALGRAVARHDHVAATFTGAGQAVIARVARLGVPTTGVSLQDTSGLSHLDRITPAALIGVLRAVISPRDPQLRAVAQGLPIAGLTGTLATRYLTKPAVKAAGVLRAKTGTLTGVNTLAGLVVDRSGRLLLFAFMASNATEPGLTVPALDDLASRLAGCGCAGGA